MGEKAKSGRPTKYDGDMQAKADRYSREYASLGEVVPTVAGICVHLDIARSTLYKWAEEKPLFSDTLERISQNQELKLVNDSLGNSMNANIAKLMLANHGYSDKVQQDNVSSDGSMTPKEPVTLSDFYATNPKS